MKYTHLLGRPFKHGSSDCYGLIRAFYQDIFDILLTNYARPDDGWEHGHNLYIDNVTREGFRLVEEPTLEWGDVIMMAIRSPVANHGAIYVGGNRILHHFVNSLSVEKTYKGMWRNRTVAVYRHPDAKLEQPVEQVDIMNLLPANVRKRLEAVQQNS